MPRLSYEERIQIVTLKGEGWTNVALADRFGVQRKMIRRLLTRYGETQSVHDNVKSGRPRVTTARDDRLLGLLSLRNPTFVSRRLRQDWIQSTGVVVTARTVRRRLVATGISCHIAKRKPLLTRCHKQKRLEWCINHRNWTQQQWHDVIFSDEVPLHIIQTRTRRYVRSRGCVSNVYRPTIQAGGGSLMVWGAFSSHGVLPLQKVIGTLNSVKYIELMENGLLPTIIDNGHLVYQQDNATCHTSNVTRQWFVANGINVMEWPL